MIEVRGVIKRYPTGFFGGGKPVEVLKGFDLTVRPGEVVGIFGPNGAGKTTLFRALCGLEPIQGGQIAINGVDPNLYPKKVRGKVALLPEEAGLMPTQRGISHLRIFGLMMGHGRKEIDQRLGEVAEKMELESFWKREFKTYSRGQKARISLARLHLMPQAEVYIFDEPSNGLDFEAVARLHQHIRALSQQGYPVLIASHILADLMHLCHRLVGIKDGRAATPEETTEWLRRHKELSAQGEALA